MSEGENSKEKNSREIYILSEKSHEESKIDDSDLKHD